MTHVRHSVVGVVIFSHFFLYDPANADKRVSISRGRTHACILKAPEICFFDDI